MNKFRLLARCGLCMVLAIASAPSRSEELFRRANLLEERIGRIDMRSAYAVRLTAPVKCDNGRDGCSRLEVYDEVLSLEFTLESREQSEAGVMTTEEPRGWLLAALAFEPDDLDAVRDDVRRGLLELSAHAFEREFAGLEVGQRPFGVELEREFTKPIWLCFESKNEVKAAVLRKTEGGMNLRSGMDPPTPICDEMRRAAAGDPPETLRTLSAPVHLTESSVEFEDRVAIDTRAAEALAPRPADARLFKTRAVQGVEIEVSSELEGFLVSQLMEDGWRFDAFTKPAAMPLAPLDDNAWLQRWTVETVDRRLGIRPEESVEERQVILVAYLPTDPPSPSGESEPVNTVGPTKILEERGRPQPDGPAAIDRAAFLDAITRSLQETDDEPGDALEELLGVPESGLVSEGWITVICHDDGSAGYALPPTLDEQRVTNADEFCAAVESRLGHSYQ